MPLLDVATLREHIETDLGDEALQRVLDAALRDVEHAHGPAAADGDVAEEHLASHRSRDGLLLFPRQPVGSVTQVTEYVGAPNAETATVLAADDYRVRPGGLLIERLSGGTNSRSGWGDRVVVVFAPLDDDAARVAVVVDLCKLQLQYEGLATFAIGGQSSSIGDYEQQRRDIVGRLRRMVSVR